MRKENCVLPLALGTFALGMSEYVMMGILPDVASSLNISIPKAGNFISLYALGVVVGSILLVIFARKKPLKEILIALTVIITLGNFFAMLSINYPMLGLFRFISGLPHGGFFGVGAIVADRLANKNKKTQMVAYMVSGMTIANLFGIPFGTFISHNFSWRITFLFVVLLGLMVIYSIKKMVPYISPLPNNGFRGQFKFLKSLAPWLLILAVVMGNGGIFCWYSYINPLLCEVSNIPEKYISLIMILSGGGMCLGNILGGKLADRFSPSLIAASVQGIATLALVLIILFAQNPILSVVLMCICTASLFAISAPQQMLLIKNAKGGEMLGASCSQISFNLGNALGAFIGAFPIAFGFGYRFCALPGAIFTFLAALALFYFYKRYEAKN